MAGKFFDCMARLQRAAGRKLSDSEVEKIFETIHKAALDMKAGRIQSVKTKNGPAVDTVINQVAVQAAHKYLAEAARIQRNASLQVIKLGARQAEIDSASAAGMSRVDALGRLIANRADGKLNAQSLESRAIGIESDMRRQITDTWKALGNDFMGFLQNTEKIKLLLKEMRGEDTGDALAKKGAKAWRDMAEGARQRFNDGGGDVGQVDNWGMPQHHSQEKVARAGKEAWIDAIMPALDRSKYVDDVGRGWDDAKMRDFLEHAWLNISTNGYSKIEPGQARGKGAVSSRHGEERVLHFQNADAYINYWGQFGEKTFPAILDHHVQSMAADIAFIEHFGPNPDAAFRTLKDSAMQHEAIINPATLGKIERDGVRIDNLWNTATGKTVPTADMRIAKAFDVLRNLNVAAKLGSAFWASAFGDKVMLETMSHLNNLPFVQRWWNETRLLNPLNDAERSQLNRQGLMLEYMRNGMARWGDQLGDSSITGKMANTIMRVSGMNAINEWRRGSFGLTMFDALGRMVESKNFADASTTDMHLMKSYGITEGDWRIWKLAQLEDYGHGNNKMLTPDAISRITDDQLRAANVIGQAEGPKAAQRARVDAITKLLGAVNSESKNAIIEPGWRERAQLYSNLERGTMKGELTKAFFQFKAFPIAQFERMWDVSMSRPSTGGKIGVLSAVMAMQVLAGAMMVHVADMLAGKDPRPMDWKFGLAAFIKGGALGLYGDFLYGINQTRYGTGLLEAAAGPTIGPALDGITSTLKAAKDASEGKETHLAAKMMLLAKGFIPGNNLWYTKAATDHLIFQQIQEALSPGYLANMRATSQREYGQAWWWEPGEAAPSRAPDLANAVQKR